MKRKIALVHGRFQPLHNEHLHDYILKAWKTSKCDFMYIGITNPDPTHIKPSRSDKQRSKPQNNPLDFIERLEIIKAAMIEAGITLQQFDIIPFPINVPGVLKYYAHPNFKHYLTIFDQWGKDKQAELMSTFGEKNVVVLFEGTERDKKITSTMVRTKIKSGEKWEYLVPPAVAKYLKEKDLIDRIIKL